MTSASTSGSRVSVVVDIGCPVARVWRALCDPAEVVRWDSGVSAAIDAPPDYPALGQHVRWQMRSGLFRVLHDRILDVVPESTLRSALSLGPWRWDERYTLTEIADGCRLRAEVDCWAALPVGAGLLGRAYLAGSTRRSLESSMYQLKRWCEEQP